MAGVYNPLSGSSVPGLTPLHGRHVQVEVLQPLQEQLAAEAEARRGQHVRGGRHAAGRTDAGVTTRQSLRHARPFTCPSQGNGCLDQLMWVAEHSRHAVQCRVVSWTGALKAVPLTAQGIAGQHPKCKPTANATRHAAARCRHRRNGSGRIVGPPKPPGAAQVGGDAHDGAEVRVRSRPDAADSDAGTSQGGKRCWASMAFVQGLRMDSIQRLMF